MKEAPVRSACDADGFRRKWGRVKELISRVSRVKEMDGLAVVVGHIRAVAAAEGGVVALSQRNRETRGEARNSRNCPTGKQLSLDPVGRPGERQLVTIADDKVMSYIKLGKCPAIVGIERVDRIVEARGVIEGFRPGIGCEEPEVSDLLLQAGLQGVVGGIGDRGFSRVAGEIKLAIFQFTA